MLVSTQQDCAEQNFVLEVESNFINSDNEKIIRLKNGLKPPIKCNRRISTYEEDFAPRQLSAEEKRHILDVTFLLGNMVVYDESKPANDKKFVHSYTLRFIEFSNCVTSKYRKTNLFSGTASALSSTLVIK